MNDNTIPRVEPWFDLFQTARGTNLNRLLTGVELRFGDPELGQRERAVTVADVVGVVAGIDAEGLFVGVKVHTGDGDTLTLYGDGGICDDDDVEVGLHTLSLAHHGGAVTQ